jgi:hypothetical protein
MSVIESWREITGLLLGKQAGFPNKHRKRLSGENRIEGY